MSNTDFDQSLTQLDVEEMNSGDAKRSYLNFNIMAIAAFVLSVLSPLTFLNWRLVPIPFAALILGGIAARKTINSPQEIGGFHFAVASLVIAFFLGGTCTVWNYRVDSKRVPPGYIAIDFEEMQHDHKTKELPEKIVKIGKEGRKIYLKGYMYQGRQMSGIKNFVLVRTKEHCKFCSPLQNPTDMIDIYLTGGKTVNYRTTPVYIGGVLHVDETAISRGTIPYFIEADIFR
ncbi:MAG: hypothetical protein LBQ54_04540 [Planctomycetaceae bacterium]|nr:hypothetical protein [Planctomycetaceae bacterium]